MSTGKKGEGREGCEYWEVKKKEREGGRDGGEKGEGGREGERNGRGGGREHCHNYGLTIEVKEKDWLYSLVQKVYTTKSLEGK